MYIFKNALKSITRTKLRNILIGIIIVIIGISSTVALSIKNSAEKLIQSYKDSYQIEGTLSLNRSSLRNDFKNERNTETTKTATDFMSEIPELNVDTIKTYGDSSYVSNYYYTIQTELNSSDIEKVTSENSTTNTNIPQMNGGFGGVNITTSTKVRGDFTVVGYSSLDAMTDFVNSTYKITSGSMFDVTSTDNVCVISEELAEANSLSVGSTINLINPNNESETYTFTVSGIYSDSSDTGEFSMFSNSANKILTTYNALNNVSTASQANTDSKLTLQTNSTFVLTSADVIDAFKTELTSKGLSSYYTLSTNVDSLDSSLAPIENLSSFSNMFLIIVLSIGGVILVVLNMINIRERKYEIGVLRAIGMKKHKVLEQFVVELFAVTFIAIIFGTVVGSILTVPVANNMLANEVSSQETASTKVNENFGFSGGQGGPGGNFSQSGRNDIRNTFSNNSKVEYVDKINAVIDLTTILELVGIGLALTLISNCVSMISISRYTPLKILSNRT